MATLQPAPEFFTTLERIVSVPQHWRDLLGERDVPTDILSWLSLLALLEGVPFNYLVADDRALPPESIRFFYVDPNWTAALQDGALSIGRVTPMDRQHDHGLASLIAERVRAALPAVRARKLKRAPRSSLLGTGSSHTGLLLRSSLVTGWPGLEVRAFADPGGVTALELLRCERLSASVLICLFKGVLQRVDLSEPPEGLQFGAEDRQWTGRDGQAPKVQLRGLGPDNRGKLLPAEPIPIPLTERRVVKVSELAATLGGALKAVGAWNGAPLTAGQLAIEMVKAPETAHFHVGPAARTPAPASPREEETPESSPSRLDALLQELLA